MTFTLYTQIQIKLIDLNFYSLKFLRIMLVERANQIN